MSAVDDRIRSAIIEVGKGERVGSYEEGARVVLPGLRIWVS